MITLRTILLKPSQITRVLASVASSSSSSSSLSSESNNFVEKIFKGITTNKRADLARSITLIETTNPEKKILAQMLLNKVLHKLKRDRETSKTTCLRVGITGPPGAGKSSLIEKFGKYLTTQEMARVAVLTVDPSSTSTGGSILGDKIRMTELSVDPLAYIRSSPNKCNLGGVTRTTLETILLCEAANFDVILVETVGVGQAEHAVVNMVDVMLLLIPPGSGDEMQGIKKGIVEMADVVAITKYDSNLTQDAIRVKSEYLSASKYIRRKTKYWSPRVVLTSSAQNKGIDDLWKILCEYKETMLEHQEFFKKREAQMRMWFWTHLRENLLEIILSSSELKNKLAELESEVIAGNITPGQASDILIDHFNKNMIKL